MIDEMIRGNVGSSERLKEENVDSHDCGSWVRENGS